MTDAAAMVRRWLQPGDVGLVCVGVCLMCGLLAISEGNGWKFAASLFGAAYNFWASRWARSLAAEAVSAAASSSGRMYP